MRACEPTTQEADRCYTDLWTRIEVRAQAHAYNNRTVSQLPVTPQPLFRQGAQRNVRRSLIVHLDHLIVVLIVAVQIIRNASTAITTSSSCAAAASYSSSAVPSSTSTSTSMLDLGIVGIVGIVAIFGFVEERVEESILVLVHYRCFHGSCGWSAYVLTFVRPVAAALARSGTVVTAALTAVWFLVAATTTSLRRRLLGLARAMAAAFEAPGRAVRSSDGAPPSTEAARARRFLSRASAQADMERNSASASFGLCGAKRGAADAPMGLPRGEGDKSEGPPYRARHDAVGSADCPR